MAPRYAIDKTLTVNDLRFHYRDWGGRGWPIVLLHGLASTSHIWDLVAPLLVEDARVIALDQRGHGQSDKPDGEYGFEIVVADLRGVLTALEIERPVLVGHSWGASVALWMAAHFPDEPAGLIMVDGGLSDLGSEMSWPDTLERLSPPKLAGTPVEEFRKRIVETAPQGLVTPAVEAAILANFEIDADNTISPRLPHEYHERILRALWEHHPADLFEQVLCPTLILPVRWEGHDDPAQLALKERGVRQAESLIADVEVVWLDRSIHDVPLQRPHRLAEEIKRFLDERL